MNEEEFPLPGEPWSKTIEIKNSFRPFSFITLL